MGGGGGGKSIQKSTTSNETISDSYNTTTNRVINASDMGNVKIGSDAIVGASGGGSGMNWKAYLPYLLLAGALLAGWFLLKGKK